MIGAAGASAFVEFHGQFGVDGVIDFDPFDKQPTAT